MKNKLIKVSRRTGRLIGWVAAILSVLAVLLIGAIYGFSAWLGTERGSAWLQSELNAVMKETPYTLALEGFGYVGGFGLGADKLEMSDDEGIFLTVINPDLDLNVLPLPLEQLWFSIAAEDAVLHRLPVSESEQADNSEFMFPTRPNIPVNRIVLDLNLDRLTLEDPIVNGGASIAVDGTQDIRLREETLTLAGKADIVPLAGGDVLQYIPTQVRYDLEGGWGGRDIRIKDFHLERNQAYRVDGEGVYSPAENVIDITLDATLAPELHSAFTAPGELTLAVDGTLDNYQGRVGFEGAVENQPLTFESPISGTRDILSFESLRAKAEGLDAYGQLQLLLNDGFKQKGQLSLTFENFNLIRAFADVPNVRGRATANVSLDVRNGQQIYSGNISGRDIIYDEIRVNTLNASIAPTSDFQTLNLTADINGFYETAFEASTKAVIDLGAERYTISSLNIKSAPLHARAKGVVSPANVDVTINLDKLDLTQPPINSTALQDNNVELAVGSLRLTGTGAAPIARADIQLTQVSDDMRVEIDTDVAYQNERLQADFTGSGTGIETLSGDVSVPMAFSILPFNFEFETNAPLAGVANGRFDLQSIAGLFLPSQHDVQGLTQLDAEFGGTLDAPLINGTLRLSQGRYQNNSYDVDIQNMNGVIAMQGRTLDIRSLTGDDGGNGDIQIAGQIDLNDVTRPVVNISANANNMQFINDDVMQLQLDANTRVVTENGIYTITGQIGADYINYTLPDRFDKRIPELNIVDEIEDGQTSLLEAVRLNMDFDSRRNINISGWGLDVRLGGSLNVVGTAAEPDVIGQLQVVRGHYEEFGRRFELGESSFRFQGPIPPSPYLNVNAVTEVEDIQAIIQMRGPATDPQIEFSSSPAMAEDRVLALILFGKDITQISPFQALQLASTARRFSGRGAGLDPLGEIQNATGLDDLRIEGGTGEGVTVGAGKYLSDDVYLEVQQGSEEGAGAARVEVELTPSVTIESQVGSRGDTGGGIFWEWDY